tara:strand:- start:328 stop:447 length:120 start_codon:yes stop_codon:yes gene_type:complete
MKYEKNNRLYALFMDNGADGLLSPWLCFYSDFSCNKRKI